MKFILITLLTIFSINSYSFSFGAKLADKSVREKEYLVKDTGVKANKQYNKSLEYLANKFKNKGSEITIKDSDSLKIVGKAIMPCKEANVGNGYAQNQRIEFGYVALFKDGKLKLKFEDVVGKADDGYDNGLKPANKEDMDKIVKGCLDKVKDELVSKVKEKEEEW